MALEPRVPLDLDEDSPELEAELLKAIDGPFEPYSSEETRAIGQRILREKHGQNAVTGPVSGTRKFYRLAR